MEPRNGSGPIELLRRGIRLAPGVRLNRDAKHPECGVLVSKNGNVELNRGAIAILDLCDGRLSRDELIARAVGLSNGQARAADIAEFLDAAEARGWILIGAAPA